MADPARRRLSRLSRSIDGSVALVTGAASGMGRATAHLFADEGARVAVVDREVAGAEAVAAEITEVGGDARAFGCDVADPVAIRELVAAVVDHFGGIGILVNNAGVSMAGPAGGPDDMFEAAWERTLAVNLTARPAWPGPASRTCWPPGPGRIVNIASTEALVRRPASPPTPRASTASSASPAASPPSWGARASPSTACAPGRSAPA